ncbi:MAG: arsenate reductase ArsC [archaeon]|nr:MAG: arsenate reductase ArsC [archaeon]
MRKVLFVCVENTFRSVLSQELFNSKAPSGWRAESAGVNPAQEVNPVVFWLLREVGINYVERKPQVVTPELVRDATRVVTFGCLDRCPIGAEEKGEDWPLPGSTGKSDDELRSVRDELSRRIDELIRRLSVAPETVQS